MAYVFLVNDDNTITATNKERVMQRSKLVNDLWFLVAEEYNELDMSQFTAVLEYVLPVSKKYVTEVLTLDTERYQDHLRYTVPLDTALTSENGDVEFQLTFAYAEVDADGNVKQHVRKTTTNTITIIPIAAWSDIVPDSALSGFDQRLIKMDAQIKQLEALSAEISDAKADSLKYNTVNGALQLTSNGKEIGEAVTIKSCVCDIDEGVPVVDIDSKAKG